MSHRPRGQASVFHAKGLCPGALWSDLCPYNSAVRAVEMGVAGTGVHRVPDPVPAEQGSSPELSSGSPGSTSISEGPSRENGTPWKELEASVL